MSTELRFPMPKNPKDRAWYGITFPYPLQSVDSISCTDIGGVDLSALGKRTLYPTPGDKLKTPLAASELQQKGSNTASFILAGGTAGREYIVEVGVTTSAGDTLFRSAALPVVGL